MMQAIRFVKALVLFLAISAMVPQLALAKTKVRASDETPQEASERVTDGDSDSSRSAPKSKRRAVYDSSQFMNVRVSPLGLLIGYVNFDFDIKVSQDWTLGPTLTYWKYGYESSLFTSSRLNVETFAVGVRGTWAQNGAFVTGLYVSPMIQFVKATASGTSATSGARISAEGNAPILTGLVGYQWYGQGFNVNVGAGLAVGASSSKVDVSDGTTSTSVETTRGGALALDFMIGYAF